MAHRHPDAAQGNSSNTYPYLKSNQAQSGPSRPPPPYTPYYSNPPKASTPRSGRDASASANTNVPAKREASKREAEEPEDSSVRRKRQVKEEDGMLMREAATRVAQAILADQIAVTYPDYKTPFRDAADVVQRLLPYHIFQQPDEDLDLSRPGTTRDQYAQGLTEEIEETKTALSFFKRRKALQDKFLEIRLREGKRAAPEDLIYHVYSLIVDTDRKHNHALTAELRQVRDEVARLEKEQRQPYRPYVAPTVQPQSQAIPRVSNAYIPYQPSLAALERVPISSAEIQARAAAGVEHRPAYATPPRPPPLAAPRPAAPARRVQTPPAPRLLATPSSLPPSQIAAPAPASALTQVPTHPIPLQIPASALNALDTLGIRPTPVASLPAAGQPQPATVLMGTRDGGQTLDITINLSLLDQSQLSGLAAVLNLLKGSGVNLQAGRDVASQRQQSQPSQGREAQEEQRDAAKQGPPLNPGSTT